MTAAYPTRSARQRDPGLAVALAFAAVAAWPLLSHASLPGGTDAIQHLYRAYEILAAWREGVLYTRWAPDFYYNYGYPVFNYYAPLTYYVAAAYGAFFGLVAGIKFTLVLASFIGTLGVYLFGRDQWGPEAGVVGAAAYAFAPYIALTDPVLRGAAPEVFAIGLGPVVLWSFSRLARTESRGFFVLSVVSLAALILSHNLISFAFAGLTGAFLIWDTVLAHRPGGAAGWLEALGRPLTAGLLAAGLTAFVWLPALTESSAVQYQNAFNFVQIRRYTSANVLLAPGTASDAEVFYSADIQFRIGLPQWILGLFGALTVIWRAPQRRTALFFALVSLATFGLMVPQADPIWQRVPMLPYLQFSFRLLGVLVPCLAWLAGALTKWLLSRLWAAGVIVAPLLAGICLFSAVPMLTPLPWPDFGPVNAKAILDFDLYGMWGVGTTWEGEFLPATVRTPPSVKQVVIDAVAAGTVEKVDRAALPAGVDVTHTQHGTLLDAFEISAPGDFELRALTFYWPGWTAYLDGAQVPIKVSDPDGFITVQIPAGSHRLLLRLEDTPPRQQGWIISAAALALFAVLLLIPERRASTTGTRQQVLPALPALALIGLAIGAVLLRLSWDVDLRSRAARDEPQAFGAQHQLFTRFDNGMALVGYDFPKAAAQPGERVPLTLYWVVTRPMALPASVFVHFYGPSGELFGQADKPDPVEFFPTTRWALGRVTSDFENALIQPNAPTGQYTVAVGLWDRSTGLRSHPLGADGLPVEADKVILNTNFRVGP